MTYNTPLSIENMPKMTLPENIRKARREIDLSQTSLAKKLGISLRKVQRIEDGETIPNVEEIKSIALILKKSVLFFILDNYDETKKSSTPIEDIAEIATCPHCQKKVFATVHGNNIIFRKIAGGT